jgi:hypothetical protein
MVLAVEKFYDLSAGQRGLVDGDNLGGLHKSRERPKKIPPTVAPNTQIFCGVSVGYMLRYVAHCNISMCIAIKISTRSGNR